MIDFHKLLWLEKQHALKRSDKIQSVDNTDTQSSEKPKLIETQQNPDKHENQNLLELLKIKTTSNEKFTLERYSPIKVIEPKFRIGTISNLYYVPNYLTEEEETLLLQHIFHESNHSKWVHLKKRRLQNWGGTPKIDGMVPEVLPPWFEDLSMRLISSGVFTESTKPNHLLINQYNREEGIMAHKDGPLYYPRVAIITLNGTARIDFQEQVNTQPLNSLLLLPRSLLVFEDETYTKYFHCIPSQSVDIVDETVVNRHMLGLSLGSHCQRTLRVSLTIRYVPHVLSNSQVTSLTIK